MVGPPAAHRFALTRLDKGRITDRGSEADALWSASLFESPGSLLSQPGTEEQMNVVLEAKPLPSC